MNGSGGEVGAKRRSTLKYQQRVHLCFHLACDVKCRLVGFASLDACAHGRRVHTCIVTEEQLVGGEETGIHKELHVESFGSGVWSWSSGLRGLRGLGEDISALLISNEPLCLM